ncbi:Tyrosine-protein kinase Src42A [Pelomyxa schiedti]|nr:Tyrosine-protein kinase Src42A [Pelomyxa schiedti]
MAKLGDGLDDVDDIVALRYLLKRERRSREYTQVMQSSSFRMCDMLNSVCFMLKQDSGCETVLMWLADPYCEGGSFPLVHCEGLPVQLTGQCNLITGSAKPQFTHCLHDSSHACIWGSVLCSVPGDSTNFTHNGSYVSNSNTEHFIDGCLFGSPALKSVMVLPIKATQVQPLGVILLADKKEAMFSREKIHLLEAITESIAVTLKSSVEYSKIEGSLQKFLLSLDGTNPSGNVTNPPGSGETRDIAQYLTEIGLPQYIELFKSNNLTISDLASLHQNQLEQMGLSSVAIDKLTLDSSFHTCKNHHLKNVQIREWRGRGYAGTVYKGLWHGTSVAIKQFFSTPNFEILETEAIALRSLRHPNILQFFGLATIREQVSVVTEIAEGSLLSLLRTEPLTLQIMIDLGRDIAAGMAYLARHKIVHEYLCARTLVYQSTARGYQVKISNFGITHINQARSTYTEFIRWKAKEVVEGSIPTTLSDVWSFGVVMWEIFSEGQLPFSHIEHPSQVGEAICQGVKLPPPNCPQSIFSLMLQCWDDSPSQRPDFETLHLRLSREGLCTSPTTRYCAGNASSTNSSSSTSTSSKSSDSGLENSTSNNLEFLRSSAAVGPPRGSREASQLLQEGDNYEELPEVREECGIPPSTQPAPMKSSAGEYEEIEFEHKTPPGLPEPKRFPATLKAPVKLPSHHQPPAVSPETEYEDITALHPTVSPMAQPSPPQVNTIFAERTRGDILPQKSSPPPQTTNQSMHHPKRHRRGQ